METTITINDEDVKKFLNSLPEYLFRKAKIIFSETAIGTHTVVLNNFSSNSAGISSDKLNSRTGNLARSIRMEVKGNTLADLSAQVYTDSIYAPIQEKGGTINAIDKYARVPGGPYLNIPLSSNKTAAGVMRLSAREVFSEGGYIAKSKLGNWFVFSVDGKPMFVLKKSVKIPPRLGMIKAAANNAEILLKKLNDLSLEGL